MWWGGGGYMGVLGKEGIVCVYVCVWVGGCMGYVRL